MNQVTLDLPVPEKAQSAVAIPAYSVHLDAVRGCAALIVFMTHLRYIFLGSSDTGSAAISFAHVTGEHLQQHAGITDLGHKAVMVFFVLSGYFVGGSALRLIRQGRWSWKRYLFHRLTRLWVVLIPALFFGLLLDSVGSRLFPNSIYGGPVGQFILTPGLSARMTVVSFLGNLFFVQTILVRDFGTNVALWSLANEFWYYLAFPLLALFFASRLRTGFRILSVILLAGILFFTGAKIAPYFLIWLFGVGIGLLPRRFPERIQLAAIGLSLFALAAGGLLLKYQSENRLPVDIAVSLLFCFLLYCILHRTEDVGESRYRTAAHFFSKMSYSLYVVNLPLLFFASGWLMQPWHRWPNSSFHLFLAAGVALAIFGVAYLFYLCFEANTDHVRRWVRGS